MHLTSLAEPAVQATAPRRPCWSSRRRWCRPQGSRTGTSGGSRGSPRRLAATSQVQCSAMSRPFFHPINTVTLPLAACRPGSLCRIDCANRNEAHELTRVIMGSTRRLRRVCAGEEGARHNALPGQVAGTLLRLPRHEHEPRRAPLLLWCATESLRFSIQQGFRVPPCDGSLTQLPAWPSSPSPHEASFQEVARHDDTLRSRQCRMQHQATDQEINDH